MQNPLVFDYEYNKKCIALYVTKQFLTESKDMVCWMKPKIKKEMDGRFYGILKDGKSGWMIPKVFKEKAIDFIKTVLDMSNSKSVQVQNDEPIPTTKTVDKEEEEGMEVKEEAISAVNEAVVIEDDVKINRVYHRSKSEVDPGDDYQELVNDEDDTNDEKRIIDFYLKFRAHVPIYESDSTAEE